MVYTDELCHLDEAAGHMILKPNGFEMWRSQDSGLAERCEEVLPISPFRVIFTLRATVSIDELVDRCVKWNEGGGQHGGAVLKLLNSKGCIVRLIHKRSCDAAGDAPARRN
jgi:hypothetical protein